MPTVIPFHRAVVDDPAFVGDGETFSVYTTWIETDFDNQIEPYAGDSPRPTSPASGRGSSSRSAASGSRSCCPPASAGSPPAAVRPGEEAEAAGGKKAGAAASGDAVTSPMQGTIVKVAVEEGQEVAEGDIVVVLEAMKMEQPLKAHKAGTVTGLQAEVGATVTNGAVICELKD